MRTAIVFLALCTTLAAKPFCTTSDISGSYAFLANGAVLVPGAPISGPFSRVGTMTANGRGSVHFSTLALYNGINFGLESFDGTYSVNRCGSTTGQHGYRVQGSGGRGRR